MGTKGTWRRPAAVDEDRLERNWRETFGGVVGGARFPVVPAGDHPLTPAGGTEVAKPPADR